jgi:hypothetical protein
VAARCRELLIDVALSMFDKFFMEFFFEKLGRELGRVWY